MYKILSFGNPYKSFETYKDLLKFIKSNFKLNKYRKGVDKLKNCNTILSDTGNNPNDTRLINEINNVKRVYRKYTIIDEYDRIMDVDKIAYDAYIYEYKIEYNYNYNFYILHHKEYEKKWEWRKSRDPKPYRGYFRHGKTANEMRANSIPEYKLYIRKKRAKHYLDQWNIEKHPYNKGYGWKQFKKVKKQYMIKKGN